MKKRKVAITLFFIVVSAFAVTSAVSAAQTDASAIRQFDVKDLYDQVVIGKLTINTNGGHYTVNMNFAHASDLSKTWLKNADRQYGQAKFSFWVVNTQAPYGHVWVGWIALTNDGGNVHGEGTLTIPPSDLATIAGWNENAVRTSWFFMGAD